MYPQNYNPSSNNLAWMQGNFKPDRAELQAVVDNHVTGTYNPNLDGIKDTILQIDSDKAWRNNDQLFKDAGIEIPFLSKAGFNQLSHFGGKYGGRSYGQALADAKASGDYSEVQGMIGHAENNKRVSSGLIGKIAPFAVLGAGAALTGGFGLGGLLKGATQAGTSGLSAAGNAFSGISGFNAASPFASTLATGSSLSSLPAGVGSAVAGIGGATQSGGWLSKLKSLKNIPTSSFGGQPEQQPNYSAAISSFNPTTIEGGSPTYDPTNRGIKSVYEYTPTKFKTGFGDLAFYNPFRGANSI